LLAAGFKLAAYDRHRTKAEELIQYGGTVAESVAKLSSNCDVVLSCLASDEAVLQVYGGADGVFANARRGALVIDLSTVNPKTSQELSRVGSERGVQVLDVTMSGSTPVAEQGALTLFGGGTAGCFAAAESIFRVIARSILSGTERFRSNHEAGGEQPVGHRNAGYCRGRRTGEKAGLDRSRLLGVLSETAVVAPAHVGKLARALNNDYGPQFPLRLMNKDFRLILDLAAAVGAQMPATRAAFEVNAAQSAQGREQDFSAVILEMEQQAHLSSGDNGRTRGGIASTDK